MSTRVTIAHGPDFHFYHEVLDDDHVYLELTTTQYESGYGRVMVPIPIHIWETIRHLGGVDLDLADKSDAQLQADVEAKVDERISSYEEALRQDPDRAKLRGLMGALVFGGADLPREEQIEQGLAYYHAKRQHQQQIRSAIQKLQEYQPT